MPSCSSEKMPLLLEKMSSSNDPEELPQKMTVGMIRRGKYYREKAILTKKNPIEIQGTMVLLKNNDLDVNNFDSDHFSESIGRGVTVHLVSNRTKHHLYRFSRGNIGKEDFLKKWGSTTAGEIEYKLAFDWHEYMGSIGVIFMRNHQYTKFYLKSFTLEDVPGQGKVHFVCNSWVYPSYRYKKDRVFFTNEPYLPCHTPEPMMEYRIRELGILRGKGSGTPIEWDREYNYSYYNDLGCVDDDMEYERPILGGPENPYPRRGRTGREPIKTDPMREWNFEHITVDNIYVPRDERFNHAKLRDFLTNVLNSIVPVLVTDMTSLFDKNPNTFHTFEDLMQLYEGGIKLPIPEPNCQSLTMLKHWITWQMFEPLMQFDGEKVLNFPWPSLIKEDMSAWKTDIEFGREMLAGVNPLIIRRLEEFPPTSKLDQTIYGYQHSSMTREQIEKNTNGQSVDEAIENNKLFILDYHDLLLPYLRRINTTTTSKIYASRTVLLLQDDDTLKPLAIELSLPHPKKEKHRPTSLVFIPAEHGIEGSLWQFAKAYVVVADCGYHQLITHWLQTHAVIEPFVIAMNRQLSVIHPVYKLLQPHFRDTMHINALARRFLINAGGVLERTIFPAKFAMEMSVDAYKSWVFTDQALPADLLKRGVAVVDPSQPHGLRLLLEDYPYAVDGLEIWSAIETWVNEYCSIYYPLDAMVKGDFELQSWWKELRMVGHGDKRDEPWWPKMNSRSELIKTCTIIIWVASALHAAVNFGQYMYAFYCPNRPSLSRRFMPEPGTLEYAELESTPEKAFMKTFTSQTETLLWMSLTEILSQHSTDEIYLGQRDTPDWTSDPRALEAFERFRRKLVEIENRMTARNNNSRWKNRVGAVKLPYTLLYPNTSDHSRVGGLTGKGIPNSITI